MPNSSPTATASEQNPRQTWQPEPHLAIATNTNCGDFIVIHYTTIIKKSIPKSRDWIKKSRDFGIEKLTGILGSRDFNPTQLHTLYSSGN